MFNPTLTQRIENALLSLDSAAYLASVLDSFEELHNVVDEQIRGIAEGNNPNGYANSLHAQFASLSSITKQLDTRRLFKDVEIFKVLLSTALSQVVDDPVDFIKLLKELEAFADAYNGYVTDQTGVNAFSLLLVSRRLRLSLRDLRGFLEYITTKSSKVLIPTENEAEISLYLLHVTDLPHFAEKLTSLYALYAELCFVFDISVASCPLRICQIESGSLWTKLFGDSRAVNLMVSLIEGSARFIYRNYTTEGKIASVPKTIESLDKILDLSNRLKESGVDVSLLQNSLAKNAVTISNSLNALLSDQPLIEINGQVVSVGSDVQKALAKEASALKLSYKSSQDIVLKVNPLTDGTQ